MSIESALRNAWAEVLDVDLSEIGDDSDFVEVGGDSVAAMRLAEIAPKHGINLDAEAIFEEPSFNGMLGKATILQEKEAQVNGVTLEATTDPALLETCAGICSLPADMIEDVYPPSATSTFFFASHQHTGAWLLQIVFQLTENLDPLIACKAFEAIHDHNQSFRSRFVEVEGEVQSVVTRTPVDWKHKSNLDAYKAEDWGTKVAPGQPAVRYGLIQEAENTYIVWTALHSVMDAWTRKLLCDDLEDFLQDPDAFLHRPSRPSMKQYSKHVTNMDAASSKAFWRNYLSESGPPTPLLKNPPEIKNPVCSQKIVETFPVHRVQKATIRLSTMAQAAIGLVLGTLTDSEHVAYINVRASRTIFPGAESIMGSIFSPVPTRIRFRPDELVRDLLQRVQDESVAMMRHEPFSFLALRDLPQGPNSNRTSISFNWYPKGADLSSRSMGGPNGRLKIFHEKYTPHPLPGVLNVYDGEDSLKVSTEYDDRIFSTEFMKDIIARFMDILNRICQSDQATRVQQLLNSK
ncbi:MAG: hypothetical protein Q9225_002808 [Loekoesia sp. 1 TL-2023]